MGAMMNIPLDHSALRWSRSRAAAFVVGMGLSQNRGRRCSIL